MSFLFRKKAELPKDSELEQTKQEWESTQRRLEALKSTVNAWKRRGANPESEPR